MSHVKEFCEVYINMICNRLFRLDFCVNVFRQKIKYASCGVH